MRESGRMDLSTGKISTRRGRLGTIPRLQISRAIQNCETPLQAAKALGISLPRFMELCRVHGLRPPGQKPTRPDSLPPPQPLE